VKQNHTKVNKECEEKEVGQDRMRLPQDSVQLGVVRKDKREMQRTVKDVETKVLKSSVVYSMKGFGIKTPALFISTSIRPNRDTAVSTIFAAVRGSPMSPSTSATFAAAGNGFALVMLREFATTL